MKHLILWAGLWGLLALLQNCQPADPQTTAKGGTLARQRHTVDTARALTQPFMRELISNGQLQAHARAELSWRTAGQLAAIEVRNGQAVTRGQLLARLDTTPLQQQLRVARVRLGKARLALQNLLIGQGYSPKDTSQVPPEYLRIARIQSGYAEAHHALQQAQYQYRQAALRAPMDGLVANISKQVWEPIGANEPFCTLIARAPFQVQFPILETELARVHTGQAVQVVTLSGDTARGHITSINPMVDTNGMITIAAQIPRPGPQLLDGMHVKVTIKQAMGPQLVIPKSALVMRQNKAVVFTLKHDSIARWNYVQTRYENSTHYAIAKGLKPHDIIITQGNLNLAHEAKVQVATGE